MDSLVNVLERQIWAGDPNQSPYFLIAEGTLRKPVVHWVGDPPKFAGLSNLIAAGKFGDCVGKMEIRKECEECGGAFEQV